MEKSDEQERKRLKIVIFASNKLKSENIEMVDYKDKMKEIKMKEIKDRAKEITIEEKSGRYRIYYADETAIIGNFLVLEIKTGPHKGIRYITLDIIKEFSIKELKSEIGEQK